MRLTALRLQSESIAAVYSSTENRALQSADIIATSLHLLVHSIFGLQERNWGTFSGQPWSEVKRVLDPMSLSERYTYVPPGGESWAQCEQRLIAAIESVTQKHPNDSVVVVTHGGSIRILLPYLLHQARDISFQYDPANASLTIFDYHQNTYTPVAVNDTSHISNLEP